MVKLPKLVCNKISLQKLGDAALSTRPRELSAVDKIHYFAEQLATEKGRMHGLLYLAPPYDFLRVLFVWDFFAMAKRRFLSSSFAFFIRSRRAAACK